MHPVEGGKSVSCMRWLHKHSRACHSCGGIFRSTVARSGGTQPQHRKVGPVEQSVKRAFVVEAVQQAAVCYTYLACSASSRVLYISGLGNRKRRHGKDNLAIPIRHPPHVLQEAQRLRQVCEDIAQRHDQLPEQEWARAAGLKSIKSLRAVLQAGSAAEKRIVGEHQGFLISLASKFAHQVQRPAAA